jgi:hypothetical protein
MNYTQAQELLSQFGLLKFYLRPKKIDRPVYFELHGTIEMVEKKNLLFRCNHNHDFIVALKDVKEFVKICQ